jgi:exodeoxyribonuclease III
MRIATYNVNSIRQRLPIVLAWLKEYEPDVMCLQETKVQDKDFPLQPIQDAGYHAVFRGMKGYNGVATLTRTLPERVVYGFHEGDDNEECRIIQTIVDGIPVVNTYVPQGFSITSEKYVFKLAWLNRLRNYFENHLACDKPAIWLGDVNVAPEPIDVYHPERRGEDPDFHIDARNAYKQVVAWGMIDVYRKLHPEAVQYTYWDFFRNALQRNFGWRIDHILATDCLAARCRTATVDMKPREGPGPSDHTVVWADFS